MPSCLATTEDTIGIWNRRFHRILVWDGGAIWWGNLVGLSGGTRGFWRNTPPEESMNATGLGFMRNGSLSLRISFLVLVYGFDY